VGYYLPSTYARHLEPADHVVNRLIQAYGPVHESVTIAGKQDGDWFAVPTYAGSGIYAYIGRIDIFQQQAGIDLREMFPAKPEMGPGYDRWTWDAFLVAREMRQGRNAVLRCHDRAGSPCGAPVIEGEHMPVRVHKEDRAMLAVHDEPSLGFQLLKGARTHEVRVRRLHILLIR
jgi:hypothetical protein